MAQMIVTTRPAHQAYQILYIGFIVAPFFGGLDKFTHVLTNWDKSLWHRLLRVCCRSQGTHSCN